jgi:CheY-like chemotaxis protein
MVEGNTQLKLLLVDDDRFLLDMYSLKFKKMGAEVDISSNILNALEKVRSGDPYDIVLIDIIMPGMDGLDFLKTVKGEKLLPHTVFIMLTNQAEEVEKAKALGVDGYIVKATKTPSEVVENVLTIYRNKKK